MSANTFMREPRLQQQQRVVVKTGQFLPQPFSGHMVGHMALAGLRAWVVSGGRWWALGVQREGENCASGVRFPHGTVEKSATWIPQLLFLFFFFGKLREQVKPRQRWHLWPDVAGCLLYPHGSKLQGSSAHGVKNYFTCFKRPFP